MSGHSKWSTIKRQKASTDQKRGQIFSKLARGITIAAREGGGDPESNFKLRLSVERARVMNMPKDNIERAIAKGTGAGGEGQLEQVLYEGFTPVSGVAMLIECVTDKKQRTVAEVKNLVEKNGGVFGNPGSAAYLFDYVGEIVVGKDGHSFDEIFETSVEAGASEVDEDGEVVIINTDTRDLQKVKNATEEAGYMVESAGLVYKAKSEVPIEDGEKNKVTSFVEKIEDHDDVQSVYVNTSLSE